MTFLVLLRLRQGNAKIARMSCNPLKFIDQKIYSVCVVLDLLQGNAKQEWSVQLTLISELQENRRWAAQESFAEDKTSRFLNASKNVICVAYISKTRKRSHEQFDIFSQSNQKYDLRNNDGCMKKCFLIFFHDT